ncbi:MAG: glycoside hydrolase TIM-barrel-like domain-containing protein [Rhizobiaceae bacterium]
MATLLLQAAGAYLGGLFGAVGATIGTAAGALGGYLIDQALINGTQHIKGARLSQMQPLTGDDGAPLARAYGTVRLGGTLIWATRFEESAKTERKGAKGGPKVTTYSYYANFAVALCEGEIAHVRRIWADGRELDQADYDIRIYKGSGSQLADPLIEAKQGADNAPAYRGTAYAVFDQFPLQNFGNRIPQLHFEVIRTLGGLEQDVRSITLIPGSTEFGLAPAAVVNTFQPGQTVVPNRHTLVAQTDWAASLDELQALCPNLQSVSLVVAWFANDLRAGNCQIRPGVTSLAGMGGDTWQVSGTTRANAYLVSEHDGKKAYGGTPDDASVIAAIRDLKARGLKVTLYPFALMDIPDGNTLPSPYGGGTQPAYPWRGDISCTPAPGVAGTVDVTAAAAAQINAFAGTATAAQFGANGETVTWGGGVDWGYRRMVLHYAKLAQLAGGVDGFLIGSEFKGLTRVRSAPGVYPFVATLQSLAVQARSLLGSGTKITYAADWSEYGAYSPPGTNAVDFNLDPLWAHPDINAIGIDNYMPISDWRESHAGGGNPDGATSAADIEALKAGIAGGEAYDWFYASSADRVAGTRTPITDGLAGKPWVFRAKDLRGWWENQHYPRAGGTESATPTSWAPRSKPIWFTELGCPAVDKGANQPNVFPDPKSSAAALPWFSDGGRDDLIQNRFLRAHGEHWSQAANNPVSPVYGAAMVDVSNTALWAWDARPYPAFPLDGDVWGDGPNWLTGHWLNGRLSALPLDVLTKTILAEHGIDNTDCARVEGFVTGFVLNGQTTAREALDELLRLYRVDVFEDSETAVFRSQHVVTETVAIDDTVVGAKDEGKAQSRTDNADVPQELTLLFRDELRDHQQSTVRSLISKGDLRVGSIEIAATMDPAAAECALRQLHRQLASAKTQIRFKTGWGEAAVQPGDLVKPYAGIERVYRVRKITEAAERSYEAELFVAGGRPPARARLPQTAAKSAATIGQPWIRFLDLPAIPQSTAPSGLRIAAWAKPFAPVIATSSPTTSGYAERAVMPQAATAGNLVAPLSAAAAGRWDRMNKIDVQLFSGSLAAAMDILVLGGANAAAVMGANGQWEVLQFGAAVEVSAGVWQLQKLLRGQLGTGDAALSGATAGASFVLLDSAVVTAGLTAEESGLVLNWKTGPQGKDFTEQYFASSAAGPAMRFARSYAPAHLRGSKTATGDLRLTWIRRSKREGDSWDAAEVPLPEGTEAYRIEVFDGSGARKSEAISLASEWLYTSAQQLADFGAGPASATISVSQIGSNGLDGIAALVAVAI